MARNQKSTSAALAMIIVKSRKHPSGFRLGFVENLNIGQSYNNEIVRGIGAQKGIENVSHGIVQCDCSWSATHTYNEHAQAAGLVPDNADRSGLTDHEPLTVLFFNADRGTFIAEAEQVLANQIGISTGAQASVKENFSGTGIAMRLGTELNT